MDILRTLLTVILIGNCLLLILLVLIQLPKKEAGAGLAFGAGAADALLGAGSGNALTQITKYSAGFFLLLALGLGVMNSNAAHNSQTQLRRALANQPKTPVAPVTTPAKPASPFQSLTTGTNLLATPATTGAASTAPATTAPATAAKAAPATNSAAPK
jgi:preprotein translocase subunit SecG